MAVDLNSFNLQTAILRASKKNFRESFVKPTFIFRGGLILKSFAQKNPLSNSEKTFAGVSCWNPGGFCNGQSLH